MFGLGKRQKTSCLVTQSVSNTFPTHKTIYFEIVLVLDVPECVKRIRLTEGFRQIYTLVSLARIFQL